MDLLMSHPNLLTSRRSKMISAAIAFRIMFTDPHVINSSFEANAPCYGR
jgi:hypothetical protein